MALVFSGATTIMTFEAWIAFTAATNEMNVTVYKARNDSFSFQIYYFNIPTCRNFNLILNCCYFFTTQQNILQS